MLSVKSGFLEHRWIIIYHSNLWHVIKYAYSRYLLLIAPHTYSSSTKRCKSTAAFFVNNAWYNRFILWILTPNFSLAECGTKHGTLVTPIPWNYSNVCNPACWSMDCLAVWHSLTVIYKGHMIVPKEAKNLPVPGKRNKSPMLYNQPMNLLFPLLCYV